MTRGARAIVAFVLIAAAGASARGARSGVAPPQPDLDAVPLHLGVWSGRDAGPIDEESARELAADSYLNRTYDAPALASTAGLYIAYYAEQRPGVSIHSPLHCLPGTGWEPLEVGTIDFQSQGQSQSVRRMLVRKNRDRALVLYWYAIHGRMVAGEAASKLWLLHDSVRLHRSDAALVRVVVPVGRDAGAPGAAEWQALSFVRAVLPFLSTVGS
jgi:EpsI family protein